MNPIGLSFPDWSPSEPQARVSHHRLHEHNGNTIALDFGYSGGGVAWSFLPLSTQVQSLNGYLPIHPLPPMN